MIASFALGGCASLPLLQLPQTIEAEKAERLARDPALADHLAARAIPQDNRWHFGGGIKRLHDPATGEPIGWQFNFNARHAW